VLDLTLVSESPPLLDLFKTTAGLQELRTLRLPRSSGFGVSHKASAFASMTWPPQLEDLCLSGGIDAHFLHGIVAFPKTLRRLTIEHCPNAKGFAVIHLLRTAVRQLDALEELKIAHMPRLSSIALDGVLHILPQLKKLSVSADYVTPAMFDDRPFISNAYTGSHDVDDEQHVAVRSDGILLQHNLQTLELTYSGASNGVEDKITAIDIMIAIDDGSIPKLRQVRVDQALQWQSAGMREEVESLTDVLQEGARRDWEAREGMFEHVKIGEDESKEVWKKWSGVWIF
jgi:hypothetical protein